jgi:hypothetical protein
LSCKLTGAGGGGCAITVLPFQFTAGSVQFPSGAIASSANSLEASAPVASSPNSPFSTNSAAEAINAVTNLRKELRFVLFCYFSNL